MLQLVNAIIDAAVLVGWLLNQPTLAKDVSFTGINVAITLKNFEPTHRFYNTVKTIPNIKNPSKT